MSVDGLGLSIITCTDTTLFDQRIFFCCVQCETDFRLVFFSFDKSKRRCNYCFEVFVRLCAALADDHKGIVGRKRSKVNLVGRELHVISVHSQEEISRLCGCVTSLTSAAGSC